MYRGPGDVRLEQVEEPAVIEPEDAIVRVTTASICGSDLHVFHGLMPKMQAGSIIGHEFTGVVHSVGPAVNRVRPGDRVLGPAAVWCGHCPACERGLQAACSRGAIFGSGPLFGDLAGAQAEYVRVPFSEVTLQRIPDGLPDEEAIFAGDILPTGYSAVAGLARGSRGVQTGDTVVVFGVGPVGLCAVASARLFDPARVVAVDLEAYRLALASRLGADVTVDATQEDVGTVIKGITGGWGAEYVVEAVGSRGSLGNALAVAAPGGVVAVVGVFQEPVPVNAPKMLARNLTLTMGMGDLSRGREMLGLIESGRFDLRPLITHRMSLDDGPRAYELLDKRLDDAVKILMAV